MEGGKEEGGRKGELINTCTVSTLGQLEEASVCEGRDVFVFTVRNELQFVP